MGLRLSSFEPSAGGARLPCLPLTSQRYSASVSRCPASCFRSTREISRGKTRYLRCIDAGFMTEGNPRGTKCTPTADGGLRGHVPARPGCTTPRIRFLFIAPRFCLGLPPDPASRRRPCPSANLRLCVHLISGLAPDSLLAMPGTHVGVQRRASARRLERFVGQSRQATQVNPTRAAR